MRLESARALKLEVLDKLDVAGPQAVHLRDGASYSAYSDVADMLPEEFAAIGIAVPGPRRSGYGLAVRLERETADTINLADLISGMAHGEVDTQVIGTIRTQVRRGTINVSEGQVFTRPLVRGISVAHHRLPGAGTLGAFVDVKGTSGVHLLSNNHVLAATNRGRRGDPVLQPGMGDGGGEPDDVIGELAEFVSLSPSGNVVDAATCLIRNDVSCEPDGLTVGAPPAEDEDEMAVEKIGRTTRRTYGTVAVFETRCRISYGGTIMVFDDQIEVRGNDGRFSERGDSGSVVCRQGTHEAVGLLFAGSDRGNLTYVNPIGPVLREFGATLQ